MEGKVTEVKIRVVQSGAFQWIEMDGIRRPRRKDRRRIPQNSVLRGSADVVVGVNVWKALGKPKRIRVLVDPAKQAIQFLPVDEAHPGVALMTRPDRGESAAPWFPVARWVEFDTMPLGEYLPIQANIFVNSEVYK